MEGDDSARPVQWTLDPESRRQFEARLLVPVSKEVEFTERDVIVAEKLADTINPNALAAQEDRAARIEISVHATTALRSRGNMPDNMS
jgi:hypothetical protein